MSALEARRIALSPAVLSAKLFNAQVELSYCADDLFYWRNDDIMSDEIKADIRALEARINYLTYQLEQCND